jgi:hypothetical protein
MNMLIVIGLFIDMDSDQRLFIKFDIWLAI